MKIKQILTVASLMIGCSWTSLSAQELDQNQKNQPFFGGEKWKVKDLIMKTETLEKDKTLNKKIKDEFDALTQQQRFMELDDKLNLQPPTQELFNWLKGRANEGYVPVMWMLASRYASINSVEESVNWTYAALLGTMQERTLCLDTSTDRALQEYMGRFSRPVLLAKSNGILLEGAKKFAIQKLASIKSYPQPLWICRDFGRPVSATGEKIKTFTIDSSLWEKQRAEKRKWMMQEFKIKS